MHADDPAPETNGTRRAKRTSRPKGPARSRVGESLPDTRSSCSSTMHATSQAPYERIAMQKHFALRPSANVFLCRVGGHVLTSVVLARCRVSATAPR
jgi:hypothetical protein